jgi:hypothetical protein
MLHPVLIDFLHLLSFCVYSLCNVFEVLYCYTCSLYLIFWVNSAAQVGTKKKLKIVWVGSQWVCWSIVFYLLSASAYPGSCSWGGSKCYSYQCHHFILISASPSSTRACTRKCYVCQCHMHHFILISASPSSTRACTRKCYVCQCHMHHFILISGNSWFLTG